jgi:hypothetical protein
MKAVAAAVLTVTLAAPAAVLTVTLAMPAAAHDVERAEALLMDVSALRRAAAEGAAESERAEATFRLGQTVETLVEALNADVAAHGTRDLFAELVVRRLQTQALNVAWTPNENRYVYDLAAFQDYLRRAPRGPSAPEAKFRLLTRHFYATLGPDPGALGPTDVTSLQRAVGECERFLAEHPGHARAATVRFFVAVDHYRLARNVGDAAHRARHERLARQALRQTVERSTETFEVRAAQTLLDRLGR